MNFADLDLNKVYTYADYIKWQFDERVELIKGKIFKMSAPNLRHQSLVGELYGLLRNFLYQKDCHVYVSPFDVLLTKKKTNEMEIATVVQPDICVVCDSSKLEMKGCVGAPDIVVEVLSPSNNIIELRDKFIIYQEAGVPEYWVVSPQDNTFVVNTLVDGKYISSRPMVAGDIVESTVLPGFTIDLKAYFDRKY